MMLYKNVFSDILKIILIGNYKLNLQFLVFVNLPAPILQSMSSCFFAISDHKALLSKKILLLNDRFFLLSFNMNLKPWWKSGTLSWESRSHDRLNH